MSTTTTAYRIAPAPKFAGLRDWDCALCGHETLRRPVFLAGAEGVVAAGTGCAAKALGYTRPELVRREFDAVEAAARREDDRRQCVRENKAAALAAFHEGRDEDPALIAARRDFRRSGGFDAVGAFPAWLAHAAETGDLGRR